MIVKVVILNWNGAEVLPRFLPSVVEGTQGVQTLATMSVKGSGHVAVFGSSFAFVDSYGANSTFGNESFFRDMLTSVTGIASSGITLSLNAL